MFQVIVNFEHVIADWETTGTTKIQNTYKFSLHKRILYFREPFVESTDKC